MAMQVRNLAKQMGREAGGQRLWLLCSPRFGKATEGP